MGLLLLALLAQPYLAIFGGGSMVQKRMLRPISIINALINDKFIEKRLRSIS